ncbi:MAG: hypothetical protein GY705_13385 [Bacteroidetes bacterium]|nr:hypothetical protein [Bacteroidota bacterium]
MDSYSVEFGELDVLITSKLSPLVNLNYQDQERAVELLVDILQANLSNNYGASISFEIISIHKGCIKARLLLTWTLVIGGIGGIGTGLANYKDVKAGAVELWQDVGRVDVEGLVDYVFEGRKCEARFKASDFINGVYGPVKSGESLYSIAGKFDCDDATIEQKIVAIFKENPKAFINNDMNILKSGEYLVIPRQKKIDNIDIDEAKRILGNK